MVIAQLFLSSSNNQIREKIREVLAFHFSSLNLNHPDILYYSEKDKLGIAEARKIKNHFSLKPYNAKGRAVVLEDASKLTIEAQNALLKTLEELPKEAIFILGASSDDSILPTVLSRCQISRLQPTMQPGMLQAGSEVENLLHASIEEKFEFIEKLKDRDEFFYLLLNYFHKKILEYPQFLKELLQAEQWKKQNVNIRPILEYLMLVMPGK